ncbi:hypothetical protein LSTR_LSTR014242 [Laodelphax striatellus]|uniref:Uncharacterized protein n=1 Tax=Laodelphax striatellus TaxID=195883 RepID=A0A482WUM1_LAOST|nr:hypothetical protein LSTR_LSTR014242 [Laodelphax striatellus]
MINADVREMSHGAAFEEVFYAPLRHWLVAASSVAFKRALVAVSSCRLFRVAVVALSWKLCDATVSLGLNCTIGRLIRVQTLPMVCIIVPAPQLNNLLSEKFFVESACVTFMRAACFKFLLLDVLIP